MAWWQTKQREQRKKAAELQPLLEARSFLVSCIASGSPEDIADAVEDFKDVRAAVKPDSTSLTPYEREVLDEAAAQIEMLRAAEQLYIEQQQAGERDDVQRAERLAAFRARGGEPVKSQPSTFVMNPDGSLAKPGTEYNDDGRTERPGVE